VQISESPVLVEGVGGGATNAASRLLGLRRFVGGSYGALISMACSAFVLLSLHPSLIFANTTTAGGDTGAHFIVPYFAWKDVFSHFELGGWSRIWYNGFPLLTFYFPLPPLLVDLLSFLIPYDIAFKLITLLGSLALPPLMYVLGRSAKLKEPYPTVLALASLGYLFDRTYTIDGGNIASTLAGEYSFSLALAFGVAFLAVVFSGLNSNKKIAGAAVLYALTALSHLLPAFFVAAVAIVYVLLGPDRREILKLALAGAVGTLLCGLWLIPFAANIYYTTSMGWTKVTTYVNALAPDELRPWIYLAVLGVVFSVYRRRRLGLTFSVVAVVSVVAFVLLPQGAVYNARALPFFVMSIYVLAATAVAEFALWVPKVVAYMGSSQEGMDFIAHDELDPLTVASFGKELSERKDEDLDDDLDYLNQLWERSKYQGHSFGLGVQSRLERDSKRAKVGAVLFFVLVTVLGVVAPVVDLPSWLQSHVTQSFVPSWASWNYSGYQAKPGWPEYERLMVAMNSVGKNYGCGPAMWEYNSNENNFGTPMALMLLPFWTHGCVDSMEGLFFESSATTPYHFIDQSELSYSPSDAMAGLPYNGLNVALGVKHLQMLGVRYYMAFTPTVKAEASADKNLMLLTTVPAVNPGLAQSGSVLGQSWNIYLVKGSQSVVPLTHLPVVWKGMRGGKSDWLKYSVSWYQNPKEWGVYRAQNGPSNWKRIAPGSQAPSEATLPSVSIYNTEVKTDSISFSVSKIGVPVVVRESYFPNWHVSGAEGPYRVAPNLMVVVPTESHVVLSYGTTVASIAGDVVTLVAVVGIVALLFDVPTTVRRKLHGGRSAYLTNL
jgi:hypothetical protein